VNFLHNYDISVVTPDTITDEQLPEVLISYAWDTEIGHKILANPRIKIKVDSGAIGWC
jgi:hypothetical protein